MAEPPPPPLSLGSRLAFGVGSAAEAITLGAVTAFAMLYYNQVLGLPAWLAGLALSGALGLDGLTDPIVGSWSDRTRSRWGRRHPFMFAAPVPIAISFLAIFNPPAGIGQVGLFLWFAVSVTALRQTMTLFHTPHLALGAELSSDYTGRSAVMAWSTMLGWAGGALAYALALAVFFAPTPAYPSGLLNPAPWSRYSLVMALVTMAALFASAWFTKDRIPYLPRPADEAPGFSLRAVLRDARDALANRNYLWLLIAYFFLSMTNGLRDGLWIYTTTFYWRLSSQAQAWFILGSLAGYVFSFLFAARFHRRFDKKAVILASCAAYALGPSVPFLLGLGGVLTPQTPGLLPFLVAWTFFTHAPISVLTISVMSAIADIADENELRHGARQEGVLYSTRAVFAKIDQAVGAAIAGGVLSLIAFPVHAVPGAVSAGVLERLAVAYALSGVPAAIALVFYARISLSREAWQAARSALDARSAASGRRP